MKPKAERAAAVDAAWVGAGDAPAASAEAADGPGAVGLPAAADAAVAAFAEDPPDVLPPPLRPPVQPTTPSFSKELCENSHPPTAIHHTRGMHRDA